VARGRPGNVDATSTPGVCHHQASQSIDTARHATAHGGGTHPTRRSNQVLIGSLDKSPSCRLRVSLSTWRGQTKVELKPCSATIPGVPMPCGPGIALPLDRLPQLINALRKAEAKAVSLGFITERAP
jgi:hypothetical protein